MSTPPSPAGETLEFLPKYLRTYVVRQDASLYTPIDQASWRFIMKLSQAFFSSHAHRKYLDGLRETGISTERIPLIEEMDARLQRFGWRAIAVSGFIPPAVFMEFLSRGVLPIACDMRKIEHLAYTPAPDIVHEAAGHAPIIADPEYAQYLRDYGLLAEKAIFSSQDMEVYLAIRDLSEAKEDPARTESEIRAVQGRLDRALAAVDHVSEATQLARMSWWTIEYGLVGAEKDPKIYGAGLLSSVSESFHCMDSAVRKIPFSIDCVNMSYDITRPQPQLYVARDFHSLSEALGKLASTMAFRLGGVQGLDRAQRARTVTTAQMDSGLQISGVLASYLKDATGLPCYLRFQGPSQLSFSGTELPGQGAGYHREGFGTPVGTLKATGRAPSELKPALLEKMGFSAGKPSHMEFSSGVTLEGVLKERVERDGRTLILAFTDCTVKIGNEILFRPEWGTYDMGCGSSIVSVHGGASDRARYLADAGGFDQAPGKPKTNLTKENRALNGLYARIREIREEGSARDGAELSAVQEKLESDYPGDWLLRYELLEIDAASGLKAPWKARVREQLEEISRTDGVKAELISRGLALL